MPMTLRRSGNAVRPMQAGIKPLWRIWRADLAREHRTHFVVVYLRVVFGIEVAVLPAPIRPAARHSIEDLPRVALRTELLVAGQRRKRGLNDARALEPLGHPLLGHPRGRLGHSRLSAILLGKDVDRDLTPGRRHHDILCLENHRTVGVDDPRRARLKGQAGIGITSSRIGTRKLHAQAPRNIEHTFASDGFLRRDSNTYCAISSR